MTDNLHGLLLTVGAVEARAVVVMHIASSAVCNPNANVARIRAALGR